MGQAGVSVIPCAPSIDYPCNFNIVDETDRAQYDTPDQFEWAILTVIMRDRLSQKDAGSWRSLTQSGKLRMFKVSLGYVLIFGDTLSAPRPVLDWIQNGYTMPLRFAPETSYQANHKSALSNQQFVSNAISELVVNHCAR